MVCELGLAIHPANLVGITKGIRSIKQHVKIIVCWYVRQNEESGQ